MLSLDFGAAFLFPKYPRTTHGAANDSERLSQMKRGLALWSTTMAKKKKGGWADVIDADGNKVNDKGIKLNQAEALLAELTGEGGETQEPVETPEPAPVEEPKAKAGKLGVKLAEALGAVLIHEDEVSVTLGKNGAQWSCNTQDGYDVALQAFQRVM